MDFPFYSDVILTQDLPEALQEQICREFSFKPMHHSHQIFGLCEACQGRETDGPTLAQRMSQLNT